MPISNAPGPGQENEPFVVDKEMTQRLAETMLEPYKKLAALYANSPEEKKAKLAEMDAVIHKTVERTLTLYHARDVTKAAITNMGQTMKDAMGQMDPSELTEENIEQELQRVREEVDAKLAEQRKKAREEANKLPTYFNEWCRATTAEVIRILQQTINGVN